jgi:type IV pilus assembly protein PilV
MPLNPSHARPTRGRAAPARQHGGSLIETLVAMLVLCFGLLGLAGTQGASLVAQRTAEVHLRAMRLAESFAEQARLYPDKVRAGAFDWRQVYLSGKVPKSAGCDLLAGCSEDAMLADRRLQWLLSVRDALPGGDAWVQVADDQRSLLIWVMWRESGALDRVTSTNACNADAVGALSADRRPSCIFVRAHL